MTDNMSVIDKLNQITTPHELLDPELFNFDMTMKPEIRQAILKQVQKVIDAVFTPIPGLEITDICLTGSATSFFYNDQSDIDIRVIVANKNCPFLSQDLDTFDIFLNALCNGYRRLGNVYFVNNRMIDIKASTRNIDFISLYSVLHDKWLIFPYSDIYKKINKNEVLKMVEEQKEIIFQEFHRIKNNYTGVELGDKLNDYFLYLITRDYMYKISYRNKLERNKLFLIRKLLLFQKVILSLGAESIKAYNRALSLED